MISFEAMTLVVVLVSYFTLSVVGVGAAYYMGSGRTEGRRIKR